MSNDGPLPHYERVPHVERQLSGNRRLVQAVGADRPTQLAGSAPLIWDLLAENPDPRYVADRLQEQFSDSLEVITQGVNVGIQSLLETSLVIRR